VPPERTRASICTRAPTRKHMHSRTHAHTRTHTPTPRALAPTHTRTRARACREQRERVRTCGPICTDAGRTEPGRPPGDLRISHAPALSERKQQFKERERA
jgi:hypothetical protein